MTCSNYSITCAVLSYLLPPYLIIFIAHVLSFTESQLDSLDLLFSIVLGLDTRLASTVQ